MKQNIIIIVALLFSPFAMLQAADKPNVIFILADDLGIGNVSCQGLHYTCVQSCGSFGRTLFSNCCKIANPDAAGCH